MDKNKTLKTATMTTVKKGRIFKKYAKFISIVYFVSQIRQIKCTIFVRRVEHGESRQNTMVKGAMVFDIETTIFWIFKKNYN